MLRTELRADSKRR